MSTRLAGLLSCAAIVLVIASYRGRAASALPAPAFPADPARWIGTPQTWDSLRGHVVLLDVWTFG
jgi:hypothetical protein